MFHPSPLLLRPLVFAMPMCPTMMPIWSSLPFPYALRAAGGQAVSRRSKPWEMDLRCSRRKLQKDRYIWLVNESSVDPSICRTYRLYSSSNRFFRCSLNSPSNVAIPIEMPATVANAIGSIRPAIALARTPQRRDVSSSRIV